MRGLLAVLVVVLLSFEASALRNPSAVYCEEMGYIYVMGGDMDFCVVDGISYPAWDFFAGKVGKEFSYCAKNGYGIITVGSGRYSPESGACVSSRYFSSAASQEYILQEDLMGLHSKLSESIEIEEPEQSAPSGSGRHKSVHDGEPAVQEIVPEGVQDEEVSSVQAGAAVQEDNHDSGFKELGAGLDVPAKAADASQQQYPVNHSGVFLAAFLVMLIAYIVFSILVRKRQ